MKPLSTIIYTLFFVISMLPQKANAAVEDDVVVGKIADTYNVTPVGQFAYSIPLAVASGTGGMEPKLSIVYNSSNGTGLLGQGFDLQGLSIISRAPQNLFNDGKADIIRFTSADRFALDGNRLQRIKAEGNVVEYRTERDSYARILAYGSQANPDSFVVYGKDGIKYKYISYINGNSLYWNLAEAIDTKGNYFTITYSGEQNQEVIPRRIDYTGNDGAGLRPYASVSFCYTSLNSTPTYISGMPVTRTKFISSIIVECDSECVRKYSMEYAQRKNKLFLSSITESTASQQKRPTRFSWDNSEQYSITNREFTNTEFKNKRIAIGDFNGDGKADFIAYSNSNQKDYNFLIYLSQGDSFASPIPFTYSIPSTGSKAVRIEEICVGDFNGDGYDDIVVERSNSPFYYLDYWECKVSNNGQHVGFGYQKTITAPYQFAHTMHVMDANCDGAADLFVYNKNYYSKSYYTLLSASSGNQVTPLTMGYSGELANDCWDNAGCVCLIDLDGDGTNEILNIKEQKAANGCGSVLYTLSPSTGELKEITGLTIGGEDKFIIGDFNGDGKTDILQMGDEKNTKWTMNLSRGVLKGQLFHSFDMQSSPFSLKDTTAIVADINGDGKSDMFVLDKNNVSPISVYINNGNATGFTAVSGQAYAQAGKRVYKIADFNGDGKTELIAYAKYNDNTTGFSLLKNANTSTDLLTETRDGLTNTTRIVYSRLSTNDVFTRGTQNTYPVVSVGCSWPVVASVSTPDGIGGYRITRYHYTDALLDKRGRGMLGFRKFQATDVNTGTTQTRESEVVQPIVAYMPKKEYTRIGSTTISETTYTNSVDFHYNAGNSKEWVYSCVPTTTHSTSYEYNTGITLSDVETRKTYDKFGNAKQIVEKSGDRIIVTENIFYNDTTNWQLGRLRNAKVRKTGNGEESSHVSSFSYQDTGLLTKEIFDSGLSGGYTKEYTYDIFGNVVKDVVTPFDKFAPRTNTTIYDSRGRFKKASINSLGYRTGHTIDEKLGVATESTDANGLLTIYAYDSFGNILSATSPLDTTKYTMWWSRDVAQAPINSEYYTKTVSTGKPTTTTFYDCLGREVRRVTESPDGKSILATITNYDNCGRVHEASNPYFPKYQPILTTTEYDKAGRIESVTDQLGRTTRYSYDGLKTTVTNANGYSSSKIVDRHGRLAKSIDADGNSICYSYDIDDNCVCVEGPTTTIRTEFDKYGNRTKLIDPDLGEISYAYNGYGELVSQTDSHGTTTFEYDVLGRLTKETRPDFTYTYSYDNQLKGFMDIKLSSNNTSIAYKYDKYGRTISETHEMSNRSFTTRTSYNNINKPDTISYPSGFKIKLNYYDTGYQQSIHNAKSGLLIWEADDYDEFGNVAVAHIGNDRYTGRIYSPVGTIIEVGTDDILYCKYEYDGCNNLTSKIDNIRGNEEYYSYDALNRLTMATTEANGKSARIINVEYDAGGNIISKSNVGNIEYKDGTNRLAMIEGYKIPEWESIKYTSFNKIKEVIATRNNGIRDIRFVYMMAYGPDKTRCMQGLYPQGGPGTNYNCKYYVGNIYDEAHNNGKILKQDYIYANGNLVAIHQTNQGNEKMLYVHLDNLGSIWAYTDENGEITEELNYDPWGRKRNPETWDYYTGYKHLTSSDRGFGGHEQMDFMDMVNMDGRMYDPYLGRFLSPDPYIQAPDNTQSLNRYAYCLNNPLSYTDPTGYSWIGNFFSAAIGIAVSIETGGFGGTFLGVMASAACGGASSAFVSSMMNGNNLWTATKSAFVGGCWGAVGGMTNYGIGSIGGDWYTRIALHSVSDASMEALQGGHFEHGLLVGMVSAGGAEALSAYGSNMSNASMIACEAALGGVVSELGGGKFANGAMTAAFQMMYNHMSHTGYYGDDDDDVSYTSAVAPCAIALCAIDGPAPFGDAVAVSLLAGAVVADAVNDYINTIYVTYTLTNPKTKQVYVGRTSGTGTPQQVANRRYSHHYLRRAQGFGKPVVDRWAKGLEGKMAIRGREQQLIDYYGGVGNPTVANRIRGVAAKNPLGRHFHDRANKYFGNIAPYTGF